ncbi:hypothetical protein M9434_003565 [Picochlorum sp. BPE23]|nr:hypothetical protein M9434_003565 [Picochlorum sp. BPE23]
MMDCGDEGKKDQEQSTVAQATEYKTSGNAYFERKEYEHAIEDYSKGIDLIGISSPDDTAGHCDLLVSLLNNRSLAYSRCGEYVKASEDALRVIDGSPCDQVTGLGKALYRGGVALLMCAHESLMMEGVYEKEYVDGARDCFDRLVGEKHVNGIPDDVVELRQQVEVLTMFEDARHDRVVALVDMLKLDIDGDDESVDVVCVLEELASMAREDGVVAALSLYKETHACRMLKYYMNEATHEDVCRVFSAMQSSCVVWSSQVWSLLMDSACGRKNVEFAGSCMRVLCELVEQNVWVKNHFMLRLWKGTHAKESYVHRILSMVEYAHLALNCVGPEAIIQACALTSLYADTSEHDSTGFFRASIVNGSVRQFLVAFENSQEIAKVCSDQEEEGTSDDPEMKAKQELRKKKDAIYNEKAIQMRKSILSCIRKVFECKALVADEFIAWKDGKKCASQLHHKLIAIGKKLLQNCPKRSTKVLDEHLNTISYEKMPYAADYSDNPAGDFLTKINLENPSDIMASNELKRSQNIDHITDNEQPVVEMYLECILTLVTLDVPLIVKLLYKAGLFSLCLSSCAFVTISTVELAQKICMRILFVCEEAKEKIVESSNVKILSGIIASDAAKLNLVATSLKELTCIVPSCSGNDFEFIIDDRSGILRRLKLLTRSESNLRDQALKLTDILAKKTVQAGKYKVLKTRNKIPKGYGWAQFNDEDIEDIMYCKHCLDRSGQKEDIQLSCFPKGFLATSSTKDTQKPTRIKAQPKLSPKNTSKDSSSFEEQPVVSKAVPVQHDVAVEQCDNQGNKNDDDIQVTEVYDSTPEAQVRATRIAWLGISQKDKITWEQTSGDISAWVKVPKGTTKDEITVQITSKSVLVYLKWYGKVLEGELYGKVKPKESTWCLEDDQVHVAMPKASMDHWWKTLIQGWEEKSYHELLKDAVNADEPHVSYDDMDESSKDLLESMLERQAYINSGLLDLENGFDDFRIVLSDSSLQGSQSNTN